MAADMCSENPGFVMSPRISFSYDLCSTDGVPGEQLNFRSNSTNSDFDFCIHDASDRESSSAADLFSDGKLLPFQISEKLPDLAKSHQPPPTTSPPPAPPPTETVRRNDVESSKHSAKEIKIDNTESNTKSFWNFKRSRSLNCGSGYAPSLCPLPLLSRSNSTGSAPNVKRSSSSSSKDSQNSKQNLPKQPTSYQKPPLKKNYGSGGGGVRVSPVLNMPTANFFGLGSVFFNGKDKNKKK